MKTKIQTIFLVRNRETNTMEDRFFIDNSKFPSPNSLAEYQTQLEERLEVRYPLERYDIAMLVGGDEKEAYEVYPQYKNKVPFSPHLIKKEFLDILRRYKIPVSRKIKKAIKIAERTHKNQRRYGGDIYIEGHIFPAAADLATYYYLKGMAISEDVLSTIILHDVKEENPNIEDIHIQSFFGDKVLRMLKDLTKPNNSAYPLLPNAERRKQRDYDYHIKLEKANLETILIKLADRYNNIQSVDSHPRIREYIRETEEFYLPLAQKTDRFYYDRLFSMVREKKGEFSLS